MVLGRDERLSDLPEFRAAKDSAAFDEVRFLDYEPGRKLMVVPEENVLGLTRDPFKGECMTIAVMARAFQQAAGLRPVDPAFEKKGAERQQYELRVRRLDVRFDRELQAAFAHAAGKGLWKGTLAARDRSQYWTAGVTAYFDAAGEGLAPVGADRPVTNREGLRARDPGLFRLVDQTMAYRERIDWRFQAARPQE